MNANIMNPDVNKPTTLIHCWNSIDYGFSERVINALNTTPMIDGKQKITLLINSPGGSLHDAWAILDYIKINPNIDLTTIGIGNVASAALMLLISGHKRYITQHCICMMHSHSYCSDTKITYSTLKKRVSLDDEIYTQTQDLYLSRTNLTKEKFNEFYTSDEIFFNSKQSLKHGFVDKVI